MTTLYSNNAYTTLSAPVIGGGTPDLIINVTDGSVFPATGNFYITVEDNAGLLEIMLCTSRATNVLTVMRGQDGTSAATFAGTELVEMRPVAAHFREFRDHNHTGVYAPNIHGNANHSASYVDSAGDTMTGDLHLVVPADTDVSDKAAPTTWVHNRYNFYDVSGAYPGVVINSTTLLAFVFPRKVKFFAAPTDTSVAKCITGPTVVTAVLDIYLDGVSIGTITFAPAATTGVVDFPMDVTCLVGERLTVIADADMGGMADLFFTLVGLLKFT